MRTEICWYDILIFITMEPKDNGEYKMKPEKTSYFQNRKRVSSTDVPVESKISRTSTEKNVQSSFKSHRSVPYFRIENIRDILDAWHIPQDLFVPLSKYVLRNVNHLEILLEIFPDKLWYFSDLSRNPNIT